MGDEPGDAELARRSLGGDRSAFSLLMARHKASVYRFIRRYVSSEADANDVLQDTFVSAWRALSSYNPTRPLDVWLRYIALNKCRDLGRRARTRSAIFSLFNDGGHEADSVSDPGVDGEASLIVRQDLQALEAAIAALPAGLRDPLVLTAIEGLSQAEAGAVLGLSAKAVEVRVYRARNRLTAALRV